MARYDLVIIGAGPGGYVAALKAAHMGAKVCLVEREEVGGTCLNRGCIPTKALIASAELLGKIRRSNEFGIMTKGVSFDLPQMMQRKKEIVSRQIQGIRHLLQNNGIELVEGSGKLLSSNLVEISQNGKKLGEVEACRVIVATGSEPAKIPLFPVDGKNVLTSNEALEIEDVPKDLIIVGGGVIGCEFACLFSEMGCEVSIVDILPKLLGTLSNMEGRIRIQLEMILKRRGIKLLLGRKIRRVAAQGGRVGVFTEDGSQLSAEKVLVCIGRHLNSEGIGLEGLGVEMERREILVNKQMETNVVGVYAIGDVAGKMQLAHVASAQGIVAVENCLGNSSFLDYRAVPNCIFTTPEIAYVGLDREGANRAGYEVKVGRFNFALSGKAQIMGETEGLVMIIAEEKTFRVLGVHILGPHASDLIHEGALAVSQGLTTPDIAQSIHAHPTLSEVLCEAARTVHDKAIHS